LFHPVKPLLRFGLDLEHRQVLSIFESLRRWVMNPVDRLLRDEMSRCLERVSGISPEGTLGLITARHPSLRGRLDEVEARLAGLRAETLERYAAWRAGLKEMEDLWALAALKQEEPGARAA